MEGLFSRKHFGVTMSGLLLRLQYYLSPPPLLCHISFASGSLCGSLRFKASSSHQDETLWFLFGSKHFGLPFRQGECKSARVVFIETASKSVNGTSVWFVESFLRESRPRFVAGFLSVKVIRCLLWGFLHSWGGISFIFWFLHSIQILFNVPQHSSGIKRPQLYLC